MDELEALAEQRVGQPLGDWTVERVLGVGAMASVYAARRTDGAVAALKVLHPHFSDVPEVRKRFLREGPLGSALATLAPLCAGLPRVYEGGETEDGATYLAMELLSGETLRDRLWRLGRLPVSEVLFLADHVLAVLVTAHQYGIVHRDLKPENLWFTQDGQVKVLDFGIARVLDPLPDGVPVLPEKTATTAGVTLGTLQYMAPEQAAGAISDIDGRADLFGLGATLFELLAGRPPHDELPGTQMLIAVATQQVPSLAQVAPDVPPAVCLMVDRALAFDKAQRYPDAYTMRLDVFGMRRGEAPAYAEAIAQGRPPPRRR